MGARAHLCASSSVVDATKALAKNCPASMVGVSFKRYLTGEMAAAARPATAFELRNQCGRRITRRLEAAGW